jgi:hypothetical protein
VPQAVKKTTAATNNSEKEITLFLKNKTFMYRILTYKGKRFGFSENINIE